VPGASSGSSKSVKQPVSGPTPAGAYSPGVIAEGRFLYVSGQGPFRDGAVVAGSIEEETELTLENLTTVLRSAGASLENVVRCGVFLADFGDFEAMNAVYERTFPAPLPARTTVGAELAGIKVEIDCVAVMPAQS
jgi:2-iminobutanoate/2-iminopropanoate deaminase